MIHVLITAALILGFLKLTDKDNVIDYFGAFSIYLAPLAFVWVADIAIESFALPTFLHLVAFLAFFIGPYFIINGIYENYSQKKKVFLSFGVFAIVVVTQLALLFVVAGNETTVS